MSTSDGPLSGRHIVLGVTGSIACYKALDITSQLVQAGAVVDIAMTASATKFVTPLTFRSLTAREPYVDMWHPHGEFGEAHVELARRADLMLIAPATASAMARLAHGLADDFVSLTALATEAPLLLAPAMDSQMWSHAATQFNRALLEERGAQFIGPAEGRLASGRTGAGRLVEPRAIVDEVRARLGRERGDLRGRTIIVSAGGTREAIDPVRFVGNHSSGKMGRAIAEAARDRGASVVLVTTVAGDAPSAVRVVSVDSADDMSAAIHERVGKADALIMAAAVADYRPADAAQQKIKRGEVGDISIDLVENEDIIAGVSEPNLVKVAFAAETQDLIANAQKKLASKGAKLIVANDVTATDAGFGTDTNRITILDTDGGREDVPLMTKYECAMRILDRVAELLPRAD
ncbi:MAG: bifunctional phosphopantothenoylcysteine decarboxylase/phosphopantothenate--cysteine ligase CoaBC [Dehalococcoidia bacterium]|jgi:phosphopantothenoylcysteine decarboxylase / phosphopantothenate---cysteine ligase|nr:bifunctional phosphopantothenoylcysteine decarboxylase/phosphopantothenate--cysteine ligase CoaBC [Dehalococcoidia bacterium]